MKNFSIRLGLLYQFYISLGVEILVNNYFNSIFFIYNYYIQILFSPYWFRNARNADFLKLFTVFSLLRLHVVLFFDQSREESDMNGIHDSGSLFRKFLLFIYGLNFFWFFNSSEFWNSNKGTEPYWKEGSYPIKYGIFHS